jgi:hypothetical protein
MRVERLEVDIPLDPGLFDLESLRTRLENAPPAPLPGTVPPAAPRTPSPAP